MVATPVYVCLAVVETLPRIVVVPETERLVRGVVAPIVLENEASPVIVRPLAPFTVELNATPLPVSVTLSVSVAAPVYVWLPEVATSFPIELVPVTERLPVEKEELAPEREKLPPTVKEALVPLKAPEV
jgi:hypothetical protein